MMSGTRMGRAAAAVVALTLALSSIAGGTPTLAAPSRAELDAARDRLHDLEREFQLVSERYNLVNERLSGLIARIGVTELEIKKLERRMTGRRDAAIAVATELYMGGSSVALEAVLTSDTLADIETRLTYLESTESAQARVFERLANDRAVLQAKVAKLEEAQARAAAARSTLAELASGIEERAAEQRDEVARLNDLIARAEARAEARAAAEAAARAASTGVSAGEVGAAPAPNPRAQAAVDAALSQVGKAYQWGAAGPDSYDCSGLTMWAWAHAGVSLPHNSGMQYAATPRVAQSDWAPGDLLFFGSPIHHVGMYIGNGQMVEAPYSGTQVRVNSAYRSDYVGAGRPGA